MYVYYIYIHWDEKWVMDYKTRIRLVGYCGMHI